MSQSNRHVKILFELEPVDGRSETESVWALPDGPGFRLDNIPFYVRGVAAADIVNATIDAGGALRFKSLRRASGHSTIRLWFERAEDVPGVRTHLRRLGCPSELDLSRLVAVDIPPEVAYSGIKAYLEAKEAAGVFEYEEGCLAQAE